MTIKTTEELSAVTSSAKRLVELLREEEPSNKAALDAAEALLSSLVALERVAFQLDEAKAKLGQEILELEDEAARLREQIRDNEARAREREKH
jgi:hypothetical protein